MKKKKFLLLSVLPLLLSFFHQANAQVFQPPEYRYAITFCSSSDGNSNNHVGSFNALFGGMNPEPRYSVGFDQNYNLRDYPYQFSPTATLNDRAKSVIISSTGGVTLIFFNNADGDYSHGSCTVYVKKTMYNYILTSFEHTYEDDYVKVQWWSEQHGLNKEVSCFRASHI